MISLVSFLTGMIVGTVFGALFTKRAKRYWYWHLTRKLQLIATHNEMLGYRIQRKRPSFSNIRRFLLACLHSISPTLTKYTTFRPQTFIRWHRKYVKQWWRITSQPRRVGRPKIDRSVIQIILDIKTHNPSYGAGRITSMLKMQLQITLSETSVRKILKHHKERPTRPPSSRQNWKTFLANHRATMASMDFKVVFDWRAKPLYILNIIDHARRKLICSEPTYQPSSEWVSQQLRNVYPFDEAPKMMLIDRDSIFLPVAKQTLPNMGITVVKTSFYSPWQNGIVERFNRTLKEELLDHIIPMGVKHLSRLLKEYQIFYNTARPHQANNGQSPIYFNNAANDSSFVDATSGSSIQLVPWIGGLHHSYCRTA